MPAALRWSQYSPDGKINIATVVATFANSADVQTFTTSGPAPKLASGMNLSADGVVIDNMQNSAYLVVTINGLVETIAPFTRAPYRLFLPNSQIQLQQTGDDAISARLNFYTGQYPGAADAWDTLGATVAATSISYIGEVRIWAGLFSQVPTGWLVCDGSVVSQTTYPDLYAIVGTLYNVGGEPAGSFRLPNLTGRFPRGTVAATPGTRAGADTVTLTNTNLPTNLDIGLGATSVTTSSGGSISTSTFTTPNTGSDQVLCRDTGAPTIDATAGGANDSAFGLPAVSTLTTTTVDSTTTTSLYPTGDFDSAPVTITNPLLEMYFMIRAIASS